MINIKQSGDDIQAHLSILQDSIGDMRPAFNSIGEDAASKVDFLFKDSIDPYGKPFAPIHHKNRTGQPLRDTGRLQASIAPFIYFDGSGVEVGTNVEYAHIHQFGIGSVKQRMFLPTDGMPEDWCADILDIINNYLEPFT